MEPRIEVIIGPRGIEVTRLVATNNAGEEKCFRLYFEIRDTLNSINQVLAGRSVKQGRRSGQSE